MQNAGKNKTSTSQNDDISPKKRRRVILILLAIYLLFSMAVVLFGQKMSPALYVCFVVPPLLLAFIVPMFAVKIDKSGKAKKIIPVVKIVLIVSTLFIITLGGQSWYKSYHLHKYRTLTPGIVTKVTYDYSAKYSTVTYYVEVQFSVKGKTRNGYCTYSYQKYNQGDSVKIAYSSKDPDFCEIDDREE